MLPTSLQSLINQLSKLPEIGPRAATRLVFYLLHQPTEELNQLADLIKNLKKQIKLCPQCFNLSAEGLCSICRDRKRDKTIICVVENVLDIIPIEKTKQYQGLYHVLGGLISPHNGIGPEQLRIKELIERIKIAKSNIGQMSGKFVPIGEIILALNPTTEGDTTALYLERLLKDLDIRLGSAAADAQFSNSAKGREKMGIKITHLGRGLSTGSSLEYTDENTLRNALLGRR